jgi:hypothetical protein
MMKSSINEDLSEVRKGLSGSSSRELIDAHRDIDNICACYERIRSHIELLLVSSTS